MKRYNVKNVRVICKPDNFQTLKTIVVTCCPEFGQLGHNRWLRADGFGHFLPLPEGEIVVLDSMFSLPVGELFIYLDEQKILLIVDRGKISNGALFAQMSKRKTEIAYINAREGQKHFKRCQFNVE